MSLSFWCSMHDHATHAARHLYSIVIHETQLPPMMGKPPCNSRRIETTPSAGNHKIHASRIYWRSTAYCMGWRSCPQDSKQRQSAHVSVSNTAEHDRCNILR